MHKILKFNFKKSKKKNANPPKISAIPLYVFHEFIPPVRRGFYCDDESIRYPFRDSKVTRQMLIVVGLLIPILLILATELFRTLAWEKKCETEFKTYHVREFKKILKIQLKKPKNRLKMSILA